MSKGELMTVAYAEDLATRDDKIDSDEATHCARTLVAVYALLGAAARGRLPRCATCGDRLATRHWSDTVDDVCDVCFAEEVAEAREDGATLDEAACVDLPHAAALRAALAKGGAK